MRYSNLPGTFTWRLLPYYTIKRSLFGGTVLFDPSDLNPKAAYNFTDISYMFQDTNGLIPVTALDDPVARVNDMYISGHFLAQGSAAERPLLKEDANNIKMIRSDGLGDYMATPNVFSHPEMDGSTAATIISVHKPLSNPPTAAGIYTFNSYNVDGSFWAYHYTGGGRYFGTRGDQTCEGGNSGHALDLLLMTQRIDLTPGTPSAQALRVRINGVDQSITYNEDRTPNTLGSTVTFGEQGLAVFYFVGTVYQGNGDLYFLFIFNYLLSDTEVEQMESWINAIVGIY